MGGICISTMKQINDLAAVLENQLDLEAVTTHMFAHNLYCRTATYPAGMIVVGKIHRHSCINFIQEGEMILVMTDGTRKHIVAPCVFVSAPGLQKAAYIIKTVTMSNVHATDTQDLEEIEKAVIVESYDAWLLEQQEDT